MIRLTGLKKHYRVHKRPPGLKAAIESLFKREYEIVKAVDGIDFFIGAGERVGFLGPNGAGKTTTLKMASGLLHPTSGEVTVDGHTPQKRENAKKKDAALFPRRCSVMTSRTNVSIVSVHNRIASRIGAQCAHRRRAGQAPRSQGARSQADFRRFTVGAT